MFRWKINKYLNLERFQSRNPWPPSVVSVNKFYEYDGEKIGSYDEVRIFILILKGEKPYSSESTQIVWFRLTTNYVKEQ